jgi:hypothetical protein
MLFKVLKVVYLTIYTFLNIGFLGLELDTSLIVDLVSFYLKSK